MVDIHQYHVVNITYVNITYVNITYVNITKVNITYVEFAKTLFDQELAVLLSDLKNNLL